MAGSDETTSKPGPHGPVPVEVKNERPTVPVDRREMEEAARRSRHVADPAERRTARTIPRGSQQSAVSASLPFAEVYVGAGAEGVALPVQNLSPTGVALKIPLGTALSLGTDTKVLVRLHVGPDDSGKPVTADLPARVAHCRECGEQKPGGLALRWDEMDARSEETLASLRELARRSG